MTELVPEPTSEEQKTTDLLWHHALQLSVSVEGLEIGSKEGAFRSQDGVRLSGPGVYANLRVLPDGRFRLSLDILSYHLHVPPYFEAHFSSRQIQADYHPLEPKGAQAAHRLIAAKARKAIASSAKGS